MKATKTETLIIADPPSAPVNSVSHRIVRFFERKGRSMADNAPETPGDVKLSPSLDGVPADAAHDLHSLCRLPHRLSLLLSLSIVTLFGDSLMAQPAEHPHEALLKVKSSAFLNGESIPPRFTCDGGDTSPPVAWSSPPQGTASLVLSMDDPDAPRGSWNHWYVYNIPHTTLSVPQGASQSGDLPHGSVEAFNDFKKRSYGGPCPPSGRHRYVITIRAVDRIFDNPPLSRSEVERALAGHILAEGRLIGTYERQ